MTVLTQACELEDWASVSGFAHATNSAYFNTSNVRQSTYYTAGGATTEFQYWMRTQTFSSDEFWIGFQSYMNTPSVAILKFLTVWSGGTRRIAFGQSAANSLLLRAYQWNGSSWDTTGTGVANSLLFATRCKYDIYIKLGNPGVLKVYKDNQIVLSETPNYSFGGITEFDMVEVAPLCTGANGVNSVSEFVVAEWNTIGSKVMLRVPDAAGTHAEWTGAGFSALDELTAALDFMISGTADQRMSFLATDFPALGTAEIIDNVRICSLANRDSGGPQNLNHFVRISTTDYHQSDKALTLTPVGIATDIPTSPASATAWTVAELNGTQFGIRSRT